MTHRADAPAEARPSRRFATPDRLPARPDTVFRPPPAEGFLVLDIAILGAQHFTNLYV
ncbi:hypothetical protein BO443_130090 [Burkholderia orbicola]